MQQTGPGSSTKQWFYFILILIAAAFPIVYLLKGDSYWFDEVFSLCAVQEPINQLIHKWMVYDVHPPLYYAVLWIWIRVFGVSEIATRALSVLFFLGSLAGYHHFMKRSSWLQYVLGLLIFVNPYVMYYVLEVRAYSLLFLLTTLFVFRFYTKGKLDGWQLFLLCLMSLCHFFGFIVSAAFCVAHAVLNWPKRGSKLVDYVKNWMPYLLAMLPGILFFAWLLSMGYIGTIAGGKFWIQSSFIDAIGLIGITLIPFTSLNVVVCIILLIGLALLLQPAALKNNKNVLVLMLQIAIAAALLVMINTHTPIFHRRYLLHFIPFSVVIIISMIRDKQSWSPGILWIIKGTMLVAGVFLGMRIVQQLNRKTAPVADLRAQAQYMHESHLPVYFVVPEKDKQYFSEYMLSKISNFYLQKQPQQTEESRPVYWDKIDSLPRPCLLQFVNENKDEAEEMLVARNIQNFRIVPFAAVYINGAFCVELQHQ